MTWTQPKVAELKKLRQAGQSASQIAATLGVSRSAVCAMAYRLKLPAGAPAPSLRRAYTARTQRATYTTLLAELRADPALLTEITTILRQSGYGTIDQLGEAADDYQDRFVEVWNAARQRRMAAAG